MLALRCVTMGVVALAIQLACASDARACSAEEKTDEELFNTATAVFVARVTRTEETTARRWSSPETTTAVAGRFTLIEVLKGTPPVDGIVLSEPFGPGNCTLPLLAGTDYLIFLYRETGAYVYWPGGTRIYFGLQMPETQKQLDKFRKLRGDAK